MFYLDKLNINNYAHNLKLYNIISKHIEIDTIEPSIKFNGNKVRFNRYTIPIFDIKYNYKKIKLIIKDLIKHKCINLKYEKFVINKIKRAIKKYNNFSDVIFGIDSGFNDKYKIYLDNGNNNMICYIFEESKDMTEKYYYINKKYDKRLIPLINESLIHLGKKYNIYDLKLSLDNINHTYTVNKLENEFHFILKNPLDFNTESRIFVIGYKRDVGGKNEKDPEITLYIR